MRRTAWESGQVTWPKGRGVVTGKLESKAKTQGETEMFGHSLIKISDKKVRALHQIEKNQEKKKNTGGKKR